MNKLILLILFSFITIFSFATKTVEVMYTNGIKDTIKTESRNLYLRQGDLTDNRGHVYRSFVVGFNVLSETITKSEENYDGFLEKYKYIILTILLLPLGLGYLSVRRRVRRAVDVV